MYVIDPAGKLVYAGAIDDKRSTNPADVKTANNYVVQALGELKAGKPVSTPATHAVRLLDQVLRLLIPRGLSRCGRPSRAAHRAPARSRRRSGD